MTKAGALCLATLIGTAGALSAQTSAETEDAPLSAIDWMSSVPIALPDADPALAFEEPVVTTGAVPTVEAAPLSDGGGTGVGILSPAISGFPSTLWQGATATDISERLDALPAEAIAPIRELRQRLLLSAAAPPRGTSEAEFLVTRLNELRALGAVPMALSLVEEAGAGSLRDPGVFAVYADIALLTGTEDAACARLRGEAALSNDLALKVFCLARGRDWNAAALALNTGEILGDLSLEMGELLAQFLEPELADPDNPPLPTGPVTPLTARLREAIGAPLATAELPRAFAALDLRPDLGWKAQLDAAERLVRTGSYPVGTLRLLYNAGVPAASGGVWDRAQAMQALDASLTSGEPVVVADALTRAHGEMVDAGLEAELAAMVAEEVEQFDFADEAATGIRDRLVLLSASYESVAATASPMLQAVAFGDTSSVAPETPLELAVAAGFSPSAQASAPVSLGLEVLDAMVTLERARGGDASGVPAALATLRSVGLESTARRAALHLLLGA